MKESVPSGCFIIRKLFYDVGVAQVISVLCVWCESPEFPLSGRSGTRSHAAQSSLSRSQRGALHDPPFGEFPVCFSRLRQPWRAAATATPANLKSSERSDLCRLSASVLSHFSRRRGVSSELSAKALLRHVHQSISQNADHNLFPPLLLSHSVSFSTWPRGTLSSTWTTSSIKVHCKVSSSTRLTHKHDHRWINLGSN